MASHISAFGLLMKSSIYDPLKLQPMVETL
jgi:hypothetical protein